MILETGYSFVLFFFSRKLANLENGVVMMEKIFLYIGYIIGTYVI